MFIGRDIEINYLLETFNRTSFEFGIVMEEEG
jgi:hypothetical protein